MYSSPTCACLLASTALHPTPQVTRGLKSTPYQDPRVTIGKPTIVVLPEWKEAPPEGQGGPREKGLRLFTVRTGCRCSR
jgi:hypothetical protein